MNSEHAPKESFKETPAQDSVIRAIAPVKPGWWSRFVARLDRKHRSQEEAAARALVQQLNANNAAERQKLRESILKLVDANMKPVKNAFEVKLTIAREVFQTNIGEAAAVEIATALTHEIIRRHRALHDKKPAGKIKPSK